ncbi:AAA family ATPase [Hymenobacter psychrophilus]|uniref:AAA domain-containing protein, putative AbiEii toxin, Type IV TA system n=1 Tax=Hymenobacter psychrophilus TaxID=651662 RepID=A0A1H3LWF7_9BACT|nr:AAA family ATPase [Hymenobacter psychrophilus]SDY68328.1 AAA domain-containing protein, putative AbiEii toxin, Type IV TA system [Hymenobacter psychrophilus]
MKITNLYIEHFRHIRKINIPIGKVLTVIAGSNGTGKTSLLGMIGHIFKYDPSSLTLFRGPFETKYSNVFQLSEKHDISGGYEYRIDFEKDSRKAELRVTNEAKKVRHRIDVGGRQRGAGKIKLPVIFLSLRRLIPLAGESQRTISISDNPLSPALTSEYNSIYNTVFATNTALTPTATESGNKRSIVPTTAQFDAYGISAGQDNIGYIILSLLSFQQLKEQDPSSYKGGLLLIDELDATLYPAAQKNLLGVLLKKGQELGLQIVFTTHSSDLLNHLASHHAGTFKNSTSFVGLSGAQGALKVVEGFTSLKAVLAELNHDVLQASKPTKINVYSEDAEAVVFYKGILKDQSIYGNVDFAYKPTSVGCSIYISLIKDGFEEFDRSIMLLDGDSRKDVEATGENAIVFLPGRVRPEDVINNFLKDLPADDEFWTNPINYTKPVYIQGAQDLRDNREVMKKWWKAELNKWGPDGEHVFKRWRELNPQEAQQVVDRTRAVVRRILDNYFKPKSS